MLFFIKVSLCSLLLLLFSSSVMSDSLRPHGLQHARLLCPSPSPRVCSNSCPLSWWCHPTILSFVISFSCLQSFPAAWSFLWVGSVHQVAKVLELQLQYQAFQRTFMDTLILFLKFSDHPVLFLHLLQSLHYCVNLVFLREVSRGLLQTSELAFINRFPKSSPNQWLGVMEIRTWQESFAQTLRSSL